ncbi:type VI secretion system tip protein VgrG [Spirosoma taeanense]|uniref:Type VI secretion system tip protein VgrG n=1 Tax=Spirosoma taeanense TaxID=2735870 RepID=A0A6M5Y5Q7_9BACT|nr:type VI secretion system tip protein VgrG [Spirosoma taeanense]QJW89135.1 type VI secretion system tip protein VgrG [Spirosoma taeanense]
MTASRLLPIDRNTDLVTFTIRVNGEALSRTVGVLSIVVSKEVNRIPTARLTLADGDPARSEFSLSNQDTFVPGNEIEITAGYHSQEALIFKGIIIRHGIKIRNNYSQLLVECRDVAVKMTVGEKSRLFADSKDSAALETILADYPDLTATIDDTTVEHKELVQYQCSDWDFMVSRADVNGLVCLVSDGTLTVTKPSVSGEALATTLFGATILEFDAEIDARIQDRQVKALAWDVASQDLAEATAAEPDWTENGDLSSSQLADVIGLESHDFFHTGQLPPNELQSWADAQLLRNRMAKTRGRVRFQGMATVLPGTVLELAGVGNRLNGKVYVSGVRHELSGGNWVCDAQFGMNPDWHTKQFNTSMPPAAGLLPAIRGLHIGVVSHLQNDPAGENRIQVKIPTISTTDEGIWARVATLDAGNERGTFFLPEVGDEVVVGFLNDDPRFPVVLGMMNSSSKPAPITAADKNPEKAYVSREKLALRFNDDKKKITLETPGGRTVTLDDDKKKISLTDKSGNSISLSGSGIVIESAGELTFKAKKAIKVEGTMDVTLKAGLNFKVEGTAGVEVSTSAIAVLKGSLVQIN